MQNLQFSNFEQLRVSRTTLTITSTATRTLSISDRSRVPAFVTTLGSTSSTTTFDSSSTTSSTEVSSKESPRPITSSLGSTKPLLMPLADRTSRSKGDTTMGLALGIPIGILGLVIILLGVWNYLKQKKKTNSKILPMTDGFYEVPGRHEVIGKRAIGGDSTGSSSKYSKSLDSYVNPYSNSLSNPPTPIRIRPGPLVNRIRESKFLKRLSHYAKDYRESFHAQDYTISPLFLKRFNLNKPMTPPSGTPDYHHKKLPKLPSLIQMENLVSEPMYKVIKNYKKILADELDITVGERVEILRNHADGWCLVKLIATKQTGMVPRNYLASE